MDDNGTSLNFKLITKALWSKKAVIVITALLLAVVVAVGSAVLIAPTYQANVLFYVNNSSVPSGNADFSFNVGELTAARQLLNTYLVVLQSRNSLDQIIEKANLPYTHEELKNMITAASVNNTEVFTVIVTSKDPEEARTIADTIAVVLPDLLSSVIKGSSVEVIDKAVKPADKASQNLVGYALVAFAAGIIIMCGYVVLKEITNDGVHGEETLNDMFEDVPVLAVIPHKSGKSGKIRKNRHGRSRTEG